MFRQRHVQMLQHSTTQAAFQVAWKHQFNSWDSQSRTFSWRQKLTFFISEGLPRSDPASFKACVRQRASFFNISIVRSCYLSFSMERMAHELFPQQLLYISSFSCKGMSMSLYCKTLFLFPSSSSKIELETCLYYEQE